MSCTLFSVAAFSGEWNLILADSAVKGTALSGLGGPRRARA